MTRRPTVVLSLTTPLVMIRTAGRQRARRFCVHTVVMLTEVLKSYGDLS